MASKGVKVKELAVELRVTSRAIIDRCRAEGWAVQNSVTRLDPQRADAVRLWFGEKGDDGANRLS